MQIRRTRKIIICGAAVALPLHLSSALAQETEYPAMEPPPDYVGIQRQQEQTNCAITGLCDQRQGPGSAGPAYYDKWTAIAMSANSTRIGASHGQDSKQGAEQLALANCRRSGALDCKSLDWGQNLCLAVAISYAEGSYGYDDDGDRARAASKATTQCRNHGGKSCVVAVAPCAGDDPRWSSPLPLPPSAAANAAAVDPRTVGLWELSINPGRWVLEVASNGTFEFHSEAMDGAASSAGTFSAHDGHWTLRATNGYSDGGTYSFQGPTNWIASGQHGTGTWHHLNEQDN